ncbi:MAG: hypothetical protein N4A33_11100 [Bacteriovoracaceae bacterium]|jgi:hypothetical protein|nr:hypothetical protein [Bacteriovoracaceae bacterium]
MIKKYSDKFTFYYKVSFFIVTLASFGSIIYFWSGGFLDGTKSKNLHRSHYILEKINSTKPINEVKSLVFSENNKIALSLIASVEKDLEVLNNSVSDDEYDTINSELQRLKAAVAALISFPRTDKVFNVLNTKVSKFHSFVSKNEWRTLKRGANRLSSYSDGYINKNSLSSIVSKMKNEIAAMKETTSNSFLKKAEKERILKRLNSFSSELNMLSDYSQQRKKFVGVQKEFYQIMHKWLGKISPVVSYQKIRVTKSSMLFISSILIIFSLSLCLFIVGILRSKRVLRKSLREYEKDLEAYITKCIYDGLEPDSNFSCGFKNFTKRQHHIYKSQISFGKVVKESLPFASAMIASSGQITWTNLAFEKLIAKFNTKIDSIEDFKDLFGLEEDNPFVDAIVNETGGIFQLRLDTKEGFLPLEIYLNPGRSHREKYVMVYIYNLETFEQTINDQAIEILSPIKKAINSMANDTFLDNKQQLQRDFEDHKIDEIFNLFNLLSHNIEKRFSFLSSQIDSAKGSFERSDDLTKKLEEAIAPNRDEIILLKNACNKFKAFTINFINESKSNLNSLSFIKKDMNLWLDEVELRKKEQKICEQNISNLISSITKMNSLFKSLKEFRQSMAISKAKLSQKAMSIIPVSDLNNSQKQFLETLEEFSHSFRELDILLKALDKASHLSFSIADSINTPVFDVDFGLINQGIVQLEEVINKARVDGEDDLVTSLSHMYKAIKKISVSLNFSYSHLQNYHQDVEQHQIN